MEGSTGRRGSNTCGAVVGVADRGMGETVVFQTKTILTADAHPAHGQVAR